MKKIYISTAHISVPFAKAEDFTKLLGDAVRRFQEIGLFVEIQYQQTETAISALVLAYEEARK
jgi:hypothetical protein